MSVASSGDLAKLEHHVQHTAPAQTPFRAFGAMTDGAESRFNRIARPDALPMLSREIEEGHQRIPMIVKTVPHGAVVSLKFFGTVTAYLSI